jgi:predicted RNA polymerase sigma factor
VGLARADPVAGLERVRAAAQQTGGDTGEALVAEALAALGRTAEARAAYERAIELDPDRTLWRTRRAALR